MTLSFPKKLVQLLVLTTPLCAMELEMEVLDKKDNLVSSSEATQYQRFDCESLKLYFEKGKKINESMDLALNNINRKNEKNELLPIVFENLNQLKSFVLADYNLISHPKIIRFFVRELQKNTSLEALTLINANNNSEAETLGAKEAIELIKSLKRNTTLRYLDISCHDIDRMDTNGSWDACIEPFVRDMVVPSNGSAAMAKLVKSTKTLTSLDLSYNNISDALTVKSLLKALTTNTSITQFSFVGNDIGPINAKSVQKLLVGNSTLTHLNLKKTALEVEGAKGIANGLKVNTTLLNLQLGENRFYFEGTCAIALSLKVNRSLVTLSLAGNKINFKPKTMMMTKFSKDGIDVITSERFAAKKIYMDGATALASCLLENTTLHQLDLSSNGISPQKAQLLQNQLQSANLFTQIYVGNAINKTLVYKANNTNTPLSSDYKETI